MKAWLKDWLPGFVAIAGAAWWIATSIGAVRAELKEDIADLELRMESRFGSVETRISVVEAKLDILIEGLNIEVSPESAGKMAGGSHSTAAVTGGKDGDGDLQREQKAEKRPT